MNRRHLGRWLILGLISGVPALAGAGDTPLLDEARAVTILDAEKANEIAVTVRGQGEDRVKFSITNRSSRRLLVVIPPGLVAAGASGQGSFQSMGLGTVTGYAGRFGGGPSQPEGVTLSAGRTAEFLLPSVCLNYGVATPTPKNVFKLESVEEYSPDPRVRKALKTLATLGTSQGVAQAVMWHVCNGLDLEQLASQKVRTFCPQELALAARFVEALDQSGSGETLAPATFQQGRVLIRLSGEGGMARPALRLAGGIEGARVLGLPSHEADDREIAHPRPGTLLLEVRLTASKPKVTTARVVVRHATAFGEWDTDGSCEIREAVAASDLEPKALADALTRAVSRAFVTVAPSKNSPGLTTMKITNRLPMTLANITLRAGKGEGDPVVLEAMGIGTMRTASAAIPAGTAWVERVELNGL